MLGQNANNDIARNFTLGGTNFVPGRESNWRGESPVLADGQAMDKALALIERIGWANGSAVDLLTSNNPAVDLSEIRKRLSEALAIVNEMDVAIGTATIREC